MADDDFESFDNLDDLDWSDVEEELKANREQIIAAAQKPDDSGGEDMSAGDNLSDTMGGMGDMGDMGGMESMDMPMSAGPSMDPKDNALEINALLDVKLEVSVEVGRTRLLIENLLALDKSSIVELNKLLGDPLDIRVNNKLVARGEVVVINDKFAVRITEIISPNDRFALL